MSEDKKPKKKKKAGDVFLTIVLIAAICVLAGIIFGMLISPRKTRIGQYYDGGECDCDCDDDDCDCSCGK